MRAARVCCAGMLAMGCAGEDAATGGLDSGTAPETRDLAPLASTVQVSAAGVRR